MKFPISGLKSKAVKTSPLASTIEINYQKSKNIQKNTVPF